MSIRSIPTMVSNRREEVGASERFYVSRVKPLTPGGLAFVGPIRSRSGAQREADAWNGADPAWAAELVPVTAESRRRVREWQRAVRAMRGAS